MNCKKCGALLPEGALVCPTCGEPVNTEVANENVQNQALEANQVVNNEGLESVNQVEPQVQVEMSEVVESQPTITGINQTSNITEGLNENVQGPVLESNQVVNNEASESVNQVESQVQPVVTEETQSSNLVQELNENIQSEVQMPTQAEISVQPMPEVREEVLKTNQSETVSSQDVVQESKDETQKLEEKPKKNNIVILFIVLILILVLLVFETLYFTGMFS